MTTARLSKAGDAWTFADMLRFTFAWLIFVGLGSMWAAELWMKVIAR